MSTKTPDQTDIDVGRAIRLNRLAKGMSQTVLADHVGVTFQQIQKIEKGVNRISMGRLVKIAGCLGVSITTLCPAGNGGAADTSVAALVQSGRTMRLLKAFNRISDRDVRECIAAMVEATANSLEGESRAAA